MAVSTTHTAKESLRRASQIIKGVKDLPSLPAVTLRVLAMLRHPDTSAARIGRVITTDAGLTTRLLRLANSAYYGYARRISTVTEAAVLLGFDTLRSAVLTASAKGTLAKALPGYGVLENGLWRHSLWTATAARLLEAKVRPALAEQAFVAGLLHDVGKIVIAAHHEAHLASISAAAAEHGKALVEAETEVLGCSHAQIGGVLVAEWRLPETLAEAICFHHHPREADTEAALAATVQIADGLAWSLGVGAGSGQETRAPLEEALPSARLSDSMVASVAGEMSECARELERLVEGGEGEHP